MNSERNEYANGNIIRKYSVKFPEVSGKVFHVIGYDSIHISDDEVRYSMYFGTGHNFGGMTLDRKQLAKIISALTLALAEG